MKFGIQKIAIIIGTLLLAAFIGTYLWKQISPTQTQPQHHTQPPQWFSITPRTTPRTIPSTTPSIRSTTPGYRTKITPSIRPSTCPAPSTCLAPSISISTSPSPRSSPSPSPSISPSTSPRTSPEDGCGGKFKAIGSKCYYIENDCDEDWLGALYQCIGMGGHLASIQSQQELDYISKELKPNSEYFIDIYNLPSTAFSIDFRSATTGLAPKFRHPELKDIWEEVCVVISSLGDMAHRLCNCGKYFVCEKNEEASQEQKQKIKKNFKKIGDKYYYIESKERAHWLKAFFICQELGGHLATPKNHQELLNISQELRLGARYYIDFTNPLELGKFVSLTSASKDNYFSSVVIKNNASGPFMFDVNFDDNLHFICEASI